MTGRGVGSGALLGIFLSILGIRIVDESLNTCAVGQHHHLRLRDQPSGLCLVEIDHCVERLAFFGFDNRTRPIFVKSQRKYLSLRERVLPETLTNPSNNRAAIAKLRHFPRVFYLDAHARFLPNVQDEPRPWLARLVLLGARGVTAMVVGSGALLARLRFLTGER